MATSISWLQKQRKGELIELADLIGFEGYEGLKKSELDSALDAYLTENATQFRGNPICAGYFSGRVRGQASPVKREFDLDRPQRAVRRRTIQATQDEELPPPGSMQLQTRSPAVSNLAQAGIVANTPVRNAVPIDGFNLPATPAMLAQAVENTAVAVQERMVTLIEESGVHEKSDSLRSAMSTIHSILLFISATELIQIRAAVLPAKHAFTVPPVTWLGLSHETPVSLPDVFLLLTSSFWSPALTWILTSFILPTLFGYFFNLTSGRIATDRQGRKVVKPPHHVVDPLTYSIAKAIVSYLVYGQGVTFDGWLNPNSIRRLNNSLYGGSAGILVGTSVTALMSIYDAILRK